MVQLGRITLIGVAAACIAALAGCGGGGGDTPSTTSASVELTTTAPDTTTAPVTTPPVTTAPVTTLPEGTVDGGVFVADMQVFNATLASFAARLKNASAGPVALRNGADALSADMDHLDDLAARMKGYTVNRPELEPRRAAIVAATPRVTDLGRRLVQAAAAGDPAKASTIATEFVAALTRLRAAARG